MPQLIDITLPADQLEGTSATLSCWLVEPGQPVNAGDPLLELETDKVSMEVSAPADGVLETILVNPGEAVEPEMILGRLAEAGAERAPTGELAATGTEAAGVAPAETGLVATTARTGAGGNNTPARIEPNGTTVTSACTGANGGGMSSPTEPDSARHLIGPAVRRLVRENNLDIDTIPGSGRGGRVTRDDVLRFLAQPKPIPTSAPGSDNTVGAPASRKIPHSTMRKTIASRMVESLLHTAPHVTSVFEMDMSNVIEHRRWHKKEYAEDGVNLTFTAYFLAAAARAIKAVPQINARYHDDGLELFEDVNIGVGTALGDAGLVVPVVPQVQAKKLFEIARHLQGQTERARAGTLTPAEMKNGTFTISNHGVGGSLFATPIIINQPQVAILGIGKLQKRALVVEVDGEDVVAIKPMCYVSLTIDHRAVDAFQTNKFLTEFVDTIENWGQ
ncbi:2-oxo acid dehydrogenase subunit E2 [Exilibacterium tricleocarpae]|uniref:Dihydrolipoamide acetyltransferase component of pyruvate dehydrogenase complex n=1 Tax=Exilibacterium tricleocarpae TaxID=2591008 RepID=A0A545SNJ7_9GAMM|nr:dihydrolipoamide acetyltransferase family protein [Exilibacterium tricleocarpae]TQV66527.1 2-oxo acid dehydrogenase subunit E2 [Exilibacterium tricleocarpae]